MQLLVCFFGKEAAKNNSYEFLAEKNTASTVMFCGFKAMDFKQ